MVDPLYLFAPGDRERIRAAVETAQNSTRAKFAFAAASASDHYVWFPVAWAALAALTATGVLALVEPHLAIGMGFAVNAGSFVVLCLLFDWWPLRVRIVPTRFKAMALRAAAGRAYAAHLMSKDDEQNGVMLFVSLAERHLEIVAEHDAHAAARIGTWDAIVSRATTTMAKRGVADGLVEAIAECGAELARAFPKTLR